MLTLTPFLSLCWRAKVRDVRNGLGFAARVKSEE
jgi:hypothetical protein